VQMGNNKYLIDLYSPTLKLAIEIDEPYHFQNEQKEKDENRENKLNISWDVSFISLTVTNLLTLN